MIGILAAFLRRKSCPARHAEAFLLHFTARLPAFSHLQTLILQLVDRKIAGYKTTNHGCPSTQDLPLPHRRCSRLLQRPRRPRRARAGNTDPRPGPARLDQHDLLPTRFYCFAHCCSFDIPASVILCRIFQTCVVGFAFVEFVGRHGVYFAIRAFGAGCCG